MNDMFRQMEELFSKVDKLTKQIKKMEKKHEEELKERDTKIEKLENENKLLKNEINDSNYKLRLLEEKINKLILLGKSSISIDKEECPQPTPYVKKYSAGILQNNK